MLKKLICFSFAALVVAIGNSKAQGQGTDKDKDQDKPKSGPIEFIDQFNKRFENKEPVIGTEIGDLKAFDENGKEVNFNDFRGKYTVLTFGCLT